MVGQRLVRRLCVDCREEYNPDEAALKQIAEAFHIDDTGEMKHIHELEQQALEGGVGKSNIAKSAKGATEGLSTSPSKVERLWKAHDGGCEACNHTGYKGRIGIYEVLGNSVEVQKLIVANGTSEDIQNQAVKEGMITMQLDGFIKALRGQTSVEEILRVTTES